MKYLDLNGLTTFWNKAYQKIDDLKQDVLVSGTNIKTIDGMSILGSGDVSLGSIREQIEKNTKNIGVNTDSVEQINTYTINGKAIKDNPKLGAKDIGAVPLNGGKISMEYLPDTRVDSIAEFSGFVSNVPVVSDAMADKPQSVFFNTTTKKFVALAGDIYYSDWVAYNDIPEPTYFGEKSADDIGYIPTTYKVYHDIVTEKLYRWGGSELAAVNQDLVLGETETTAYAGDKGKKLREELDAEKIARKELNANMDTKTEAEDTSEVINGIEETLVTNALRKSAQTLTDSEKTQARKNIGAASANDYAKAISDLNKQQGEFESSVRNVVNNYKPIVINGNVNNAADEEDITTDENNLLKLKDRNNLDGMGYVILRKNKTFAEQVTQPNTIYEIRYDFDLGGEEVTIPSNSVLNFAGGSLIKGRITLQGGTIIKGGKCNNVAVILRGESNQVLNTTIINDEDSELVPIRIYADNNINIQGCYLENRTILATPEDYYYGGGAKANVIIVVNKDNESVISNINISDNTINHRRIGIEVYKVTHEGETLSLNNLTIHNNIITALPNSIVDDDTYACMGVSIAWEKSYHVIVQNNVIKGSRYGIELATSSTVIADNNNVSNCVSGIACTGKTLKGARITNNLLTNNILFIGYADGVIADNNMIVNSGLRVINTSNVLITNTQIHNDSNSSFSSASIYGGNSNNITINNTYIIDNRDTDNYSIDLTTTTGSIVGVYTNRDSYKANAGGGIEISNYYYGNNKYIKPYYNHTFPSTDINANEAYDMLNGKFYYYNSDFDMYVDSNGCKALSKIGNDAIAQANSGVINIVANKRIIGIMQGLQNSGGSYAYQVLTTPCALTYDNNTIGININKYDAIKVLCRRYINDNWSEWEILQASGNSKRGTTTNRPTIVNEGYEYYDTTIKKPIWWNGTSWVDATGAEV